MFGTVCSDVRYRIVGFTTVRFTRITLGHQCMGVDTSCSHYCNRGHILWLLHWCHIQDNEPSNAIRRHIHRYIICNGWCLGTDRHILARHAKTGNDIASVLGVGCCEPYHITKWEFARCTISHTGASVIQYCIVGNQYLSKQNAFPKHVV